MIPRPFPFLVLVSKGTDSSLNREELTSLRNSVRLVTVELHSIAGVLDSVLRRNGGPVKGSERRTEGRSLSDHLNHPTMEEVFRNGRLSSTSAGDVVFDPPKKNVETMHEYILPFITSAILFGLSVLGFAYDLMAICGLQALLLSSSTGAKVYKPQAGRYYSPVPGPGSDQFTPAVVGRSVISAVLIQSTLALNLFPLTVCVYTLRVLSLIPLLHMAYDRNNSTKSPAFGLS